ncbi:hypothetical protein DFJ73DRAFT_841673 [Zopfochytrium polystomum]|nr:hypothetical protein DFJ73DRAFT_841673 [Zopfochytrium polystomum]
MPSPPAAAAVAGTGTHAAATRLPLFSECLPIVSTVSCTPYTSRFYINSTALASRYASILPFFAQSSQADSRSGDSGVSKFADTEINAPGAPILTAAVWDQIVSGVTNPADPVARYFAIASAAEANGFGLLSIDPCMSASASSTSSQLEMNRRSPSVYFLGGEFVANHQISDPTSDGSPGYWGAAAAAAGGENGGGSGDGQSGGGLMFQRSVVCGHDLFVASAGCNSAVARHALEAAVSDSPTKADGQEGAPASSRKSKSAKTRLSRGSATPVVANGPVVPFCSSMCTMVSNSLVEAANARVAADPSLAENCLRRRDHPATSMCSSVVDGMRSVLEGLGEDVNSGYCSMGVDDDRTSCGYAASADATAFFCASSLSDVPTVNDACCSHVTLSHFPKHSDSSRAKFLASSPMLASLLGATKAVNLLASPPTAHSPRVALVSYEWGSDEPTVNDDGIVDLSSTLLYDATDYYMKSEGGGRSKKESSTAVEENVAAVREARNSISGYLVSSFLPLSWQKGLVALVAESGMDEPVNDGDSDVAEVLDVIGDDDEGAGKAGASGSSSKSAPKPTGGAGGGDDDGDDAAAKPGGGAAGNKDDGDDGDTEDEKKPAGGTAGGDSDGDDDAEGSGPKTPAKPAVSKPAAGAPPKAATKLGSSAAAPKSNPPPSSSLSPGAIIAIIVAGLIVVVAVVAGIVTAVRNRRKNGYEQLSGGVQRGGTKNVGRQPSITSRLSVRGRAPSVRGPRSQGVGPPQAPSRSDSSGTRGSKIREVHFEYDPVQDDELSLWPTDLVEVSFEFGDGWATGKNMRTGKIGVFPLTCLDGGEA